MNPSGDAMADDNKPAALPLCDLVMKGGITSGVVYPRLITRLAREWRFKSVGGTSAGAIAAAGCAAAELGRHRLGHAGPFDELARLPKTLGAPAAEGCKGSMLFHLFQPAPQLQGHFSVLLGALNRKGPVGIVFGAFAALLLRFWPMVLLAVLLMSVFGVPALQWMAGVAWFPAAVALLGCLGLTLLAAWVVGQLPAPNALKVALVLVALPLIVWAVVPAATGLTGPRLLPTTFVVGLWLVVTAVVMLLVAAAGFLRSLLAGLRDNLWGLCSGHQGDGQRRPQALTDWLTGYFDGLAQQAGADRPLTFGDLWGLEPAPPTLADADAPDPPPRERRLDLQVMTTAISQHLCYALPLRPGTGGFYYDPQEWRRLFPPRVMGWLDRVSQAIDDPQPEVQTARGRRLRRLPPNRHLPVVVAVRMSLSFPVLLSAVPLYAFDTTMAVGGGTARIKRVWFSDGGIASNMPLHFFDAPLPGRPTFAVNLQPEHPRLPIDTTLPADRQEGRVYLPRRNSDGRLAWWADPDEPGRPMSLFGLLGDIVLTMQNWRDQIQLPYPGYRDRIVRVHQKTDEGGLNLNMPDAHIEQLANAGEHAGALLSQTFHPQAHGGGWANHRNIRLRSFLSLTEDLLRSGALQDEGWDEVVRAVESRHLNAAEAAQALRLLAELRRLGREFGPVLSFGRDPPKPLPQMRISPRI
jgi:predicted acylesterase/phospholipase RssA